jgi:hypothetical protein
MAGGSRHPLLMLPKPCSTGLRMPKARIWRSPLSLQNRLAIRDIELPKLVGALNSLLGSVDSDPDRRLNSVLEKGDIPNPGALSLLVSLYAEALRWRRPGSRALRRAGCSAPQVVPRLQTAP